MNSVRLLLALPILLAIGCASGPPEDQQGGSRGEISAREKVQTETATATGSSTSTATVTGSHTGTATITTTGTAVTSATDYYTITGTVTGTVKVTAYYLSWPGTSTNTITNTRTTTVAGPMQSLSVFTNTVTKTVTNSRNGTETKTVTAAVTGFTTFTGTTTVTATNTVTTTAGARQGSGTRSVTATGTAVQTGTAVWTSAPTATATQTTTIPDTRTITNTNTFVQTVTLTSTDTSTGTGTSTPGLCLADWRNTTCGQWCSRETQQDRANCQVFVECYRTHNCGPTTCGGPDQVCGVNVVLPKLGSIGKDIADQVYQCMACPGSTPVTSCTGKPDTAPCASSNACVTNRCLGGQCALSTTKQCQPIDQCHTAGTCNPTTGQCDSPVKPDGTSCEDGLFCTIQDVCMGGTCQAGEAKPCPPPVPGVQCHGPGVCDEAARTCVNPPVDDGTTCDDSQLCTANDACQAGTCKGDPVICDDPGQCLVRPTCDPTNGCNTPPVPQPDGTTCNDGLYCTISDVCMAGTCQGGEAKPCPPPIPGAQCQKWVAGVCDETKDACTNPNEDDWVACDDGDPNTQGEVCVVGTCKVEQKQLVTVADWQGNPLAIPVVIEETATATELYRTTSGADGNAYIPYSLFHLGMGGVNAVYAISNGVHAGIWTATQAPGQQVIYNIVIGKPVKLTVRNGGGTAVQNARIQSRSVHLADDAKHTEFGVTRDVYGATDSNGELTVLVMPGKYYDPLGADKYPLSYQFLTTEPGGAASVYYFGEHGCPASVCDCDVSRCIVAGNADDCSEGTINIGSNDASLPLAFDRDSQTSFRTTGNAFMRQAADVLDKLATDTANFQQVMTQAFGKEVDTAAFNGKVLGLQSEIQSKNYVHALPQAQVDVPRTAFPKNMGAFHKDSQTVLIASNFTGDTGRGLVYMTEFGHFIGNYLREGTVQPGKNQEAPGHEADIFYLLATGVALSQEGLNALMSDDHGTAYGVPGYADQISVRFGFWSWAGAVYSFVHDGVVYIEDVATNVATTIYKVGGQIVGGIGGYVYDVAKGAGHLMWTAAGALADLPSEIVGKLQDLCRSGLAYTVNTWVAKLTGNLIHLEDFTNLLNIVKAALDDANAGITRMTAGLGQIASGDIEGGLANFTAGLVEGSYGAVKDGIETTLTDVLIIVDDLFMPPPRMLNKEEREKVTPVFCGSVNLDQVRLMQGGPIWAIINAKRGNRAITLDDDIYLFGSDEPGHATLTHELTHVWQYQHGGDVYKMVAFDWQIYGGGGYDWSTELDGNPNAGWLTLNPESQAQLIEDMFSQNPSFWPSKQSFVYNSKNYTPRAFAAASYLIRGIGAPTMWSDKFLLDLNNLPAIASGVIAALK